MTATVGRLRDLEPGARASAAAAPSTARGLHFEGQEVLVHALRPVPSTPASFRALLTDDEAARAWSEERRMDLILSILLGEMGLCEAAELTGLSIEEIERWKAELLFDGRPPWEEEDGDDADLTLLLVT